MRAGAVRAGSVRAGDDMGRMIVGLCVLLAAPAVPTLARSLPKSDPAPELRACPEMGEGYVRLAGSGTCVRLSGSVRVEVTRQSGGSSSSGQR